MARRLSHVTPDTSLVVVSYRRPDCLARQLAAVQHTVGVVVVNVENDPVVESVAVQAGATVVPMQQNAGYAAAVNAGVRCAVGEVVVFGNDDVLADASAVHMLADVVRRGDADVAVPKVVDPTGVPEPTLLAPPTPWALAVEWLLLPDTPIRAISALMTVEKWRLPAEPEPVFGAAAALVATRRRVLLEEPIPEAYFLYWEEQEWFWRLRRRGLRVQYRPEVTVQHAGGRLDVRPEKCALLARNAVRCVRRTQGRASAAIAWPIVVAWWLRLVAVDLLLGRGRWRVRARWAGLRAALAAVREVSRTR